MSVVSSPVHRTDVNQLQGRVHKAYVVQHLGDAVLSQQRSSRLYMMIADMVFGRCTVVLQRCLGSISATSSASAVLSRALHTIGAVGASALDVYQRAQKEFKESLLREDPTMTMQEARTLVNAQFKVSS